MLSIRLNVKEKIWNNKSFNLYIYSACIRSFYTHWMWSVHFQNRTGVDVLGRHWRVKQPFLGHRASLSDAACTWSSVAFVCSSE